MSTQKDNRLPYVGCWTERARLRRIGISLSNWSFPLGPNGRDNSSFQYNGRPELRARLGWLRRSQSHQERREGIREASLHPLDGRDPERQEEQRRSETKDASLAAARNQQEPRPKRQPNARASPAQHGAEVIAESAYPKRVQVKKTVLRQGNGRSA